VNAHAPQPIIFLGSGAFGVPTLAALARTHNILAIATQPDKPAGRGMKLTPTPVAQYAWANLPSVPVFKPDDINATPVRNQLRALAPSACVVIAFGQKLGPELLDGLFAINLHASLLPRWRGAAPINAAVLAGDDVTGNSVITLAQRMDAGLILAQSRRPIDPATTAGELHDLLANDGPALVLGVLAQHAAGTLNAHAQDETLVTKARKLSKADALLNFARPAEDLRRQIHALTPWPGVRCQIGPHPVKLLRVATHTQPSNNPTPGTLLSTNPALISCAPGNLEILQLQPDSGQPMTFQDFTRSRPLTPGTTVQPR